MHCVNKSNKKKTKNEKLNPIRSIFRFLLSQLHDYCSQSDEWGEK